MSILDLDEGPPPNGNRDVNATGIGGTGTRGTGGSGGAEIACEFCIFCCLGPVIFLLTPALPCHISGWTGGTTD